MFGVLPDYQRDYPRPDNSQKYSQRILEILADSVWCTPLGIQLGKLTFR